MTIKIVNANKLIDSIPRLAQEVLRNQIWGAVSLSTLSGVAKIGMLTTVLCFFPLSAAWAKGVEPFEHPRLYFDAAELEELRALHDEDDPVRALIWENVVRSAEWCAQQPIHEQWFPYKDVEEDPVYEILYDRFYGAMRDTAVLEHLALTSALSKPEEDRFFEPARNWALALAKKWGNEADEPANASKAYAVLRVMKSLAIAYDVLYEKLSESDREQLRSSLLGVGRQYYPFFQEKLTAGEGYNKHHGSVDASPFGIMGLALFGDVPDAEKWLDIAVDKHVNYLLENALTPSGTSIQTSNFWASTLQYRIFFLDALRRVTGRDLFAEFPRVLPGEIALGAVAGGQPQDLEFNQNNRSVLFGPAYGQINYWSPVLLYLARHHRSPLFQHIALWDKSLGSLQRTIYVTPNNEEEMLFTFGPYCYMWYDQSVPNEIDKSSPLSYQFPEPEVNETYMRSSFNKGDLVVGVKKGGVLVHCGGRVVMEDLLGVFEKDKGIQPVETNLTDDGQVALIECDGPSESGLKNQRFALHRPNSLKIERKSTRPLTWAFQGKPARDDNAWVWSDGTKLELLSGKVTAEETTAQPPLTTGMGKLKLVNRNPAPPPINTVTVEPQDGQVTIAISKPQRPQ